MSTILKTIFYTATFASATIFSQEGKFAYHEAVEKDDVREIIRLAEQGHDPEELDDNGRTPLYLAVLQKKRDCVLTLIQNAHADPNAVLAHGKTALHAAIHKKYIGGACALVKNGAQVTNNIEQYIRESNSEFGPRFAMKIYVPISNINALNSQGNSFFHMEFLEPITDMKRARRVIRCLMKKGADPFKKNSAKKTPFELAGDGTENITPLQRCILDQYFERFCNPET